MEDDLFFEGSGWDEFVSDIRKRHLGPDNSLEELFFIFEQLRRALQRKSALYWHHFYLNKYITNKIVPFGLRIQIFPTIPIVSDSLKNLWEENLTECSIGMMNILKDHYNGALDQVEKEIHEIYAILRPFSDNEKCKAKKGT